MPRPLLIIEEGGLRDFLKVLFIQSNKAIVIGYATGARFKYSLYLNLEVPCFMDDFLD
ncbi:MAG: hypothetical protein Kow0083_00820 [Methylophaga sp.]